jgi:hypothetical protein
MAAKLEKTRTPGIFKRGSRYVFSYRVNGKQRWVSCRTLEEARRKKRNRETAVDSGSAPADPHITLPEYILGNPDKDEEGWIDRYRGNRKRGFREETRAEYRALLRKYTLAFFAPRTKLAEITPLRIDQFIAWLVK